MSDADDRDQMTRSDGTAAGAARATRDQMAARYDRRARTYARWWAPVLEPAATALLDLVAPELGAPGARMLDVGTGTGTLAMAAARRFQGLAVTALDLSAVMLEQARAEVASLDPTVRDRIAFAHGALEDVVGGSIPAARFDVALSSFVLQLVPDRVGALRAIGRALQPGGVVALVTWADNSKPDAPEAAWAAALDEALRATGTPHPSVPDPPRAGPIASPAIALAELAAAGFGGATAERAELVHDFGRAGARAQIVEYDHAAELEALADGVRARVIERLDEALARLPDGAFTWRAPLIRAVARRPA